jgi:hypothetical protein
MATKKIIKNRSGQELKILGVYVPDQGEYEVPPNKWLELSGKEDIIELIEAEDIIINNGIEDLPIDVASMHVKSGTIKIHRDVQIKTGVGINAPEIIELNHAVTGYLVGIGDKGYFDTRIDNLINNTMNLDLHYCIDNSESNKYVKFRLYISTSSGDGDLDLTTSQFTVDYGPFEVSTNPYVIKKRTVTLPPTVIDLDRPYIFIGMERIDPGENYPSPTNNPILVRVCKEYWKRVVT